MIGGCVPLKNMQLVKELLSNERFHYVELHHKSCIQDKLWELGKDIQEHNLIEITYARRAGNINWSLFYGFFEKWGYAII